MEKNCRWKCQWCGLWHDGFTELRLHLVGCMARAKKSKAGVESAVKTTQSQRTVATQHRMFLPPLQTYPQCLNEHRRFAERVPLAQPVPMRPRWFDAGYDGSAESGGATPHGSDLVFHLRQRNKSATSVGAMEEDDVGAPAEEVAKCIIYAKTHVV